MVALTDGIILYRLRKLIHSWGEEVEDQDAALTDEEQHRVERWFKLMKFLSILGAILLVLRFVFFELLPILQR